MKPRRLASLAALPLLLLAGPALAQPQAPQPAPQPAPMFTPADAAAARAVIDRYFAAFSAKDYATFRQVFTAPYVWGGRQFTTLPTLDDVVQRYQAIRSPLEQADYSASKAVEVRIVPLSANGAFAHVHWRRLKKDGGLLNEGAEVLILAKVDGQWKLTGVVPEDLRQFRAGG
jgi:hypothetical protein